jgi:hypothetical protein
MQSSTALSVSDDTNMATTEDELVSEAGAFSPSCSTPTGGAGKKHDEVLTPQPKVPNRNSMTQKGDQAKKADKVSKRVSVIGLPSMTRSKHGGNLDPPVKQVKASSLQLKPPGSGDSGSARGSANLSPGPRVRESLNVRRATMLPNKKGGAPARPKAKGKQGAEADQKVEAFSEEAEDAYMAEETALLPSPAPSPVNPSSDFSSCASSIEVGGGWDACHYAGVGRP